MIATAECFSRLYSEFKRYEGIEGAWRPYVTVFLNPKSPNVC